MEDGFIHSNGSQGRRAFHADVTIYCCWLGQWWVGEREHEALVAQLQSHHGFTSIMQAMHAAVVGGVMYESMKRSVLYESMKHCSSITHAVAQ